MLFVGSDYASLNSVRGDYFLLIVDGSVTFDGASVNVNDRLMAENGTVYFTSVGNDCIKDDLSLEDANIQTVVDVFTDVTLTVVFYVWFVHTLTEPQPRLYSLDGSRSFFLQYGGKCFIQHHLLILIEVSSVEFFSPTTRVFYILSANFSFYCILWATLEFLFFVLSS